MLEQETVVKDIPRPLETYPSAADQSLAAELAARVHLEPFNALATGVFLLAILHAFAAARFAALAHRVQHRHDADMAWTVFNAHYPALFLGGFLFFLGFARATAPYQSRIELKTPLLVGFFLAGLVIHGGLQGWWIAPVLSRLPETPLFLGATALTAVNDNTDHVSGHARAESRRRAQARGGARGGRRRRPDGHRQRAESRRSGALGAILQWCDLAARPPRRRCGAHAHRGRSLSRAVTAGGESGTGCLGLRGGGLSPAPPSYTAGRT